MHREPDGLVAVLRHPELEQRRRARRNLQLTGPAVMISDQVLVRRVCGHAQRTGVRNRHGDRVQADRAPNSELLRQQADRRDEALPFQVRLDAGEQQERVPALSMSAYRLSSGAAYSEK